ncbi:hypothetical protein HN51_007903 [Arachis hypogaea]
MAEPATLSFSKASSMETRKFNTKVEELPDRMLAHLALCEIPSLSSCSPSSSLSVSPPISKSNWPTRLDLMPLDTRLSQKIIPESPEDEYRRKLHAMFLKSMLLTELRLFDTRLVTNSLKGTPWSCHNNHQEAIKFICKDFLLELFKKHVDNLRTNPWVC